MCVQLHTYVIPCSVKYLCPIFNVPCSNFHNPESHSVVVIAVLGSNLQTESTLLPGLNNSL